MNSVDANNIFELYVESVDEPQMHVDEQGIKQWRLKSGVVHRQGAPAVVFPNGDELWVHLGMMHRTNGPARKFTTNAGEQAAKEWWVQGKEFDDVESWAIAALAYEGKEPTEEMIEQKIQQVMQQDLFS